MLRMKYPLCLVFIVGFWGIGPAFAAPPAKSATVTVLTGVVRGADGRPMEGVTISAAAIGGTITTSVYSDEQGRYFCLRRLPANIACGRRRSDFKRGAPKWC